MHCSDKTAPPGRPGFAQVDALDAFDAVIDARSPAEYSEDHIPGAVNLPVLDNAERARVGTIYTQASSFAAKRIGAALVSRNIARHLETYFAEQPKGFRPLVYCWRGGSRSGAMTHILRTIGWDAAQLEGGYKAYRRAVRAELAELPLGLRFVVICGPTGVGKSRFLRAIEEAGGQVLDLEEMAAHMGSVLGAYPDRPQPGQKLFESLIWARLRHLSPDRPVFVESESKKIGNLHTPEVLLEHMRAAECLNLDAPMPVRVALLKEEYAHFLDHPAHLNDKLDCLIGLKGHPTVARWKRLAAAGEWDALVADLLREHYDPAYTHSLARNYPRAAAGPDVTLSRPDAEALRDLARTVLVSFA